MKMKNAIFDIKTKLMIALTATPILQEIRFL
jgi:hypothetical protein